MPLSGFVRIFKYSKIKTKVMKKELQTGRPLWAFIGTIVLLISLYFDYEGAVGTSNILLFIGCFIFGAVFQSIRQERKNNLPL